MIHKYYQASRTPYKLNYLVQLVWQRLQVDRKNIEKMVNFINLQRHTFLGSQKLNSLVY